MTTKLLVRLTPKGGRDWVEGWAKGADGQSYLKARVRAAPEGGKANAALVSLLAEFLNVSKSQVRIVSGATSRLKRIEIDSAERELAARFESLGGRG